MKSTPTTKYLLSASAASTRKGSRDNVVRWIPRLRAAVDAAEVGRAATWDKESVPVPIHANMRPLIVASNGGPLKKSSPDTAWQRFITNAIEEGAITEDQRFDLHDLKRRGITDTPSTRAEKQDASGHRSESMMDVHGPSKPMVDPSAE